MRFYFLPFLLFFVVPAVNSQTQLWEIACIGFYNFENLFDTLDNPEILDEEFTPAGAKLWTSKLYKEKLSRLASIIEKMGTELTPDGPAILGIAEVENRGVLEDLVKQPGLKDRQYRIIHYDSPDKRGIDVAMIYQPKYFIVDNAQSIELNLFRLSGEKIYTRDVLLVSGQFRGEPFHVLVNHWPSRSGGEKASAHLREGAASQVRNLVDSLLAVNPANKIIVMGDLNDDPVNASVKHLLRAIPKESRMKPGDLYNPMYGFYKKGYGTTAWRDAWSLFDQIIISQTLIHDHNQGYRYLKARVMNERFLVQPSGQFKGYPLRSFVGNSYMGGYSDHFPVYIFVGKPLVHPITD